MNNNIIPPITNAMGKYWRQPSAERILIDDTHALMEQATFAALNHYSCSLPSAVYHGKMWRRHDGVYDPAFIASGGKPEWLLMWFGPSACPSKCSINSRKILLV